MWILKSTTTATWLLLVSNKIANLTLSWKKNFRLKNYLSSSLTSSLISSGVAKKSKCASQRSKVRMSASQIQKRLSKFYKSKKQPASMISTATTVPVSKLKGPKLMERGGTGSSSLEPATVDHMRLFRPIILIIRTSTSGRDAGTLTTCSFGVWAPSLKKSWIPSCSFLREMAY